MSLRNEGVVAIACLALCGGLAVDFPFAAFSGRAAPRAESVRPAEPVAFVTLSPEAEDAALRRVRGSSRRAGSPSRFDTDLFFEELPEATPSPVLSVAGRTRPSALPTVELPLPPCLPSRKAPPPRRIAAEAGTEAPEAFPRDELLQIE